MPVRSACCAWLLLAALAAASSAFTAQSTCDVLHQKYAKYGAQRWVSAEGRPLDLRVIADERAPARAAAALLAAGLRHALRYDRVRVSTTSDVPQSDHDNNLVLVPSAVWAGGAAWAGAARLRAAGRGAAPARLRLLARLAPAPRAPAACRRATRWAFYSDPAALAACSFLLDAPASEKTPREIRMYYPAERQENAYSLAERARRFGLRLRPVPLGYDSTPRHELLTILRGGNDSFLFLDYDIWSGFDRVYAVDPPPDENELDLTYTVRFADTWTWRRLAPDVLQAFHAFDPSAEDLRRVLEIEAQSPAANVTEAACEVAANIAEFDSWFDPNTRTVYEIAVYLCRGDPDNEEYERAVAVADPVIRDLVNASFPYRVSLYTVECGDEHALMRALLARAQSVHWPRLAGALAAGAGAAAAAGAGAAADALGAALVLYAADAPPPRTRATRLAAARLDHLVLAMRHFVSKYGWTRLAVLSASSRSGSALAKSLKEKSALLVGEVAVDSSPEAAVRDLLKNRARIVFVDLNSTVALSVLCAARELGATPEAGHVWILRERDDRDATCPGGSGIFRHYTISFRWRGGNVSDRATGTRLQNVLDATWPGGAWPPLAASLIDAYHLLMQGFQHFLRNHPQMRFDIHGGDAPRLFWDNLEDRSTEGVMQTLRWDKYGLKNPLVYIDRWDGNRRDLLAVWQIDDDEAREVDARGPAFPAGAPGDGAEPCLVAAAGDAFAPQCHDGAALVALACGALAAPALLLARRLRRRRLRRRRRAASARLLRLAGPLARLLVERATLRLRGELGAGRFGVVRAAALRTRGRTVDVAAKALREESTPAEEREFLNEALVLASLRHERVVRVVGVCVGGGPPLVLMELAFFRDLLGYLRERRPLTLAAAAAGAGAGSEAAHVAAAALTRLARQAAEALAYLATSGVVHRDVRAANCLVDSRRSLKLADFGLARRAAAGGEYECRRRGPLPVPWMAPESLERGAFSAASDVWGLGVLLLELATLGARPYGAWPPQRVLRYVSAGGRPPLPPDATPETRRVLARCWHRSPSQRAPAAELAAALSCSPPALAPALAPPAAPDVDVQ